MHLTLPRGALQGQPFGGPDSLQANPSNPPVSGTQLSPQIRKTPPLAPPDLRALRVGL